MAEFAELMKQERRMCGSISCDNCILPRGSDEMCIWEDAPARLTDEVIAEIEAKTMKWAAENPEVRYPTWREWQQDHFPDAANIMHPCAFMRISDVHCCDFSTPNRCRNCANQPIPAEIAEKLGVKPIPIKPQQSIVDEYEHTKNRAYNLNHYLNWLNDVVPEVFEKALRDFSGMPGYTRE